MDRVLFLPTGPWRAARMRRQPTSPAVLASLMALLLLAVASAIFGPPLIAAPAPAVHAGTLAHGAATLPPAALGGVSGALGHVDPAYRVRALGGGLSAANPGQQLQAEFTLAGASLTRGDLRLGMSLRALSLGRSARSLAAVAPVGRANEVSFSRTGVREWYVNGPLGVEQGFTIARPRRGAARASGPATLAIALSGNAVASLSDHGQSVVFSRAGRPLMRYGDLHASDASGRALRTSLSLTGGELLLRVDARGARYPLTVDPLFQQSRFVAHDGDAARFGFKVAMSADGTTALVAARRGNGRGEIVWVFARSGGVWSEQTALTLGGEEGGACEGEGECPFAGGLALSVDGNTALVGAPAADAHRGTALVFTRRASTWTQEATLSATEETARGHFGRSVALSRDGNTAVVGGPADRNSRGAAWVFDRQATTWSEVTKLADPDDHHGDRFGRTVAIAQGAPSLLVGAPGDEHNAGATWAYSALGSTWLQDGGKLTGAGEGGEGRFGITLALAGNGSTALIGGYTDEGGTGAAWAFTNSGSGWTQQGAKLTAGEAEPGSKFAFSVALSTDGNTAVLGAPRDRHAHGSAWVFRNSGTTWTQTERLTSGGENGRAWFGGSAALSNDGTRALVAGYRNHARDGAVWVYHDGSKPPVEEPPVEVSPEPPTKSSNLLVTTVVVPLPASGVLGSTSSALPAPVLGVSANLVPLSGKVFVKLHGSNRFVALRGAIQVPFGTIIDARHGKVSLTTARRGGGTQKVTFYEGMFRISQQRNGQVIATLVGGNFNVCPTAAERRHLAHASATRSSRKHSVRKLWAEGHGSYSTKGNYATGAVLGTRWLTEDRCDGTLIRVLTDKVAVSNHVNHRHRTVRAGHSYLAKAPG
jgi:hypothetical protein